MNNQLIQEFLQDFENRSEVVFLEESKEKNEIIQIAKAKGINLKNNADLSGIKCIYAFADLANKNGAVLPEQPLLKALPTMIGKPINAEHNRRYVLGHIIDYRYVQKDKKVIMYGVVYRSNFVDEWEKVKKDFKDKKLNVSFEIWCPPEKRRALKDGTYELLQQEIAGCAILFRDSDPAFPGAKVLSLAKNVELDKEVNLVFASKYKCTDIITAKGSMKCSKCGRCKKINPEGIGINAFTSIEKGEETPPNLLSKIKCGNCNEEFEYNGIGDIKCSKCLAILDRSGNMIYPPQVNDFRVLCPGCKVNQWLIVSKKEDKAKLRCLHCSKEYQVIFDMRKPNELLDKLQFVYTGSVNCYQCNRSIYYSGVSSIKERTLKCPKCDLEFSYNLLEGERYKKIKKIEEIVSEKNSDKGGNKMADKKDKKVSDEEKVEETKKEVEPMVETETIVDIKVVEPVKSETEIKEKKVEESKKEDEPMVEKTENKVEEEKAKEEQIETKTENAPTVEEKKPEVKVEDAPKAEKVEEQIEKVDEVKEAEKIEEAKFEYEIVDNEELEDVEAEELAEAKKMTYQEKKALPDSSFAVVVNVKNKKTGKVRKIRMYPINDEAHVRNALARLGQPAPQATLKKLGVSVEAVRKKVLRRAKQLKMTQLIKRHKVGARKLALKYKEMKKAMESKIDFYKENAQEISERRKELEGSSVEITDIDILDDEKFATIKAEKENATIEKAEVVGNKSKNTDYFAKKRQEIDDIAFGRKKGTKIN